MEEMKTFEFKVRWMVEKTVVVNAANIEDATAYVEEDMPLDQARYVDESFQIVSSQELVD